MANSYDIIPQKATVQPSKFTVFVTDDEIAEFRALLRLSRIGPSTFENSQPHQKYGITRDWLKNAKNEWLENFTWRIHEKKMNSLPHFITPVRDVDGQEYKIHFVGLFSEKEDAIPIVLLHGWPGSFLEFLPILTLFKKEYSSADLPYHLIVPSLPGYAFSSGPPQDKDFGMEDIARVVDRLLIDLGFGDGYIAQGGDLGSRVAQILSVKHEACKAIHINLWMNGPPEGFLPQSLDDPKEIERFNAVTRYLGHGTAYAAEHSTKPGTIGLVLSTSPLALLSWVGEKFMHWTDDEPPLEDILESVTLYWFTETFPRCIYPYREIAIINASETPRLYMSKPLGFSWFPKEVVPVPKIWIESAANLVFFRRHQKGGHFAAIEQPTILKTDLVDFVTEWWPKVNRVLPTELAEHEPLDLNLQDTSGFKFIENETDL